MLTIAAAETIGAVADTTNVITMTMFGMELNAGVESYKVLYQGRITNAVATKYTAPSSTEAFVKSIHLANTSAADVSGVILYLNGTGAGQKICAIGIPANGMAIMGEDGWRVYTASGELVKRISNLSNTDGFRYQFGSGVTIADPGVGGFSLNNATPTSATKMCIFKTTQDSGALSPLMQQLLAGKTCVLQMQNVTRDGYLTIVVNSIAADNTSWYELNVTVTQDTLTPVVLTNYYLVFMAAWPALPLGIASVGRLAYKRSTTTTNADPGAAFFRISNTDVGSNADAFSLYISDVDNNGQNRKEFLNAIVASDNKLNTMISISTGTADAGGILARVTAISTLSGYTKLDCVMIHAGFTDPANNAVCELMVWTNPGAVVLPPPAVSTSALCGMPGFCITHQTTEAMPSNTAQMLLYPFSTRVPIRIRRFHWNLGTAGVTQTTGRLGIYRAGVNNASMPRLGANMLTLAAVTTMFLTTGAQVQTAGQNLPPGHYWLALAIGALGGSPVMKSCFGNYNESNNLYLTGDSSQNAAFQWATRWTILGAFTTTFAAEGTLIGNVTYTALGATNAPITPLPVIMEYQPLV